jgi:bacillopeptidase F (M6 metalloprotease family)
MHDLPRDAGIVVYCAGGYRSSLAIGLLEQHGFVSLVDLDGGMTAWEDTALERVMYSGKQTCQSIARSSFPRTRESSPFPRYWIPACAGMTFPCGMHGTSIPSAGPSTCITRSRYYEERPLR